MTKNISFSEAHKNHLADKWLKKVSQCVEVQEKLNKIYKNNHVNRTTLFLANLFYSNHKLLDGRNPNAGFIIGFDSVAIGHIVCETESILGGFGRQYIIIDMREKSLIDGIKSVTGKNYKSSHEAFVALKEILLHTDKVVVFREFSKCKIKTNKSSMVSGIIKIIDDAHHDDIFPLSDLIFVDYAEFLQKSWGDICSYISIPL